LKSKTTTFSSCDFSGYSESDKPQYNKHNQRVRGPFGVETKKNQFRICQLNLMSQLDGRLDEKAR